MADKKTQWQNARKERKQEKGECCDHFVSFVYVIAVLLTVVSPGSLVSYEKDPIGTAAQHVYDIVDAKADDAFHSSVRNAVTVIEEALDRYR